MDRVFGTDLRPGIPAEAVGKPPLEKGAGTGPGCLREGVQLLVVDSSALAARTTVPETEAVLSARIWGVDACHGCRKGRPPAAPNLGDYAACATAALAGLPLLYMGDDLAQTDVEAA